MRRLMMVMGAMLAVGSLDFVVSAQDAECSRLLTGKWAGEIYSRMGNVTVRVEFTPSSTFAYVVKSGAKTIVQANGRFSTGLESGRRGAPVCQVSLALAQPVTVGLGEDRRDSFEEEGKFTGQAQTFRIRRGVNYQGLTLQDVQVDPTDTHAQMTLSPQ